MKGKPKHISFFKAPVSQYSKGFGKGFEMGASMLAAVGAVQVAALQASRAVPEMTTGEIIPHEANIGNTASKGERILSNDELEKINWHDCGGVYLDGRKIEKAIDRIKGEK